MTEPKTASEYLDRGCDKDDQKDSKGAIEDYTKALELNPNYAEAYANRGCAKEELGDKEGAIADWQKAADLGDEEAAKWIREVDKKKSSNKGIQKKVWVIETDLGAELGWGSVFVKASAAEDAKQQFLEVFGKTDLEENEEETYDPEIADANEIDSDSFLIWKGKLLQEDSDHSGRIYIPKRIVEENPDIYAEAELEDLEECEYFSDEEIANFAFTEPMMVCFISNMNIIDPTTGEQRMWLTEIDEFHNIRSKDAHDASVWLEG